VLHKKIEGLTAVSPEGGKWARAAAAQPAIEAGQVFLPQIRLANGEYHADRRWVDDFVATCAAFPRAAHDDDVDALTQLLAWCHAHPHVIPFSVCRPPEPYFRRPRSFFPDPPDGRLQFRRCSNYIFGRHPLDSGDPEA
jgi:hypothetical protein